MKKQTLAKLFYIPVVIYFANAVYYMFADGGHSAFLQELQTGLLFLILAEITRK